MAWIKQWFGGQGEGEVGRWGWVNEATGARLIQDADPNAVVNPYVQSVMSGTSGQGEGASFTPGALDPQSEYAKLWLDQALAPESLAQGNFDVHSYLQGLSFDSNPHNNTAVANDLIRRIYADTPGSVKGNWTPWESFEDWNSRNPKGSWTDMFKTPFEAAKDLWAEPGFRQLLLTAVGGAAMGNAAAAGATAGEAAASGAATGGGVGLNPLAGGVGLNPAAAGVGLQATPAAVAAFDAGVNIPGLAGAVGGAATGLGAGSLMSGAGGVLEGLGDLWGGVRDFLPSADTAAAVAPIIAAIAYARNQGPFDTSRLTSTYDQFEPDALAYEYDQNTAAGRNALTSSLTNRGVMGSSFGNMDLTNFQTSRDLGRRSLVNQGLASRGGLASSILDAQVKERQLKNQLYGTSLLALGNVFGGRNQPSYGVP